MGPLHFIEGETEKIECDFTAPAGAVYWYKDDKLTVNGTQGLYHKEDQLNDDTFRSTLHFSTVRLEHEGFYKSCTADSICSKYEIEVLAYCGEYLPGYRPSITLQQNTTGISKQKKNVVEEEVVSTFLECYEMARHNEILVYIYHVRSVYCDKLHDCLG